MPLVKHGGIKAPGQHSGAESIGAFLSDLPEPAARSLLENAHPVTYPRQSVVSAPGSPAQPGLIVAGRLWTFLQSSDGRQVVIAHVGAGQLVGLANCLVPGLEITTQALTAVEIVHFECGRLQKLMESDGGVAIAMARRLVAGLDTSWRELRAHVFGSARQRIAHHLLDLAQPDGRGGLAARVTQQQLADAAGMVREHASRMIREFRTRGLVSTARGSILLIDAEELRSIARIV
jgi:CRP/FNR family cyclic AMP-dependent transcriptional regulator